MLDEETGYGFNAAQLTSLSSYTNTLMSSTSGMTYWFNEDQPNSFTSAQYHTLLASGGYQMPQVYTTSMEGTVNYECSTYGGCANIITECYTCSSGSNVMFNSWTYAIDNVSGNSEQIASWGTGYWFNWYQYP
jgi:hypothetical protein